MVDRIPCPLPTCQIVPGDAALFGHHDAITGAIHTGLDLVAPIGTPIHAPLAGVVLLVFSAADSGLNIHLVHTDRITTIYAHLSRSLVRQGDRIEAGRIIGYTGASGMVTGPHLHFAVMVDGNLVDPAPLLGLTPGGSALPVQPPPWKDAG